MRSVFPGVFIGRIRPEALEEEFAKMSARFGQLMLHERSGASGCVSIQYEEMQGEYQAIGQGCFDVLPHTDSPHIRLPPAFVALGCIRAAELGGETILVDGFGVISALESEFGGLVSMLSEKSIECRRNNISSHYFLLGKNPIRKKIRFRNDPGFENIVPIEISAMFEFFCSYVCDERNQVFMNLNPGDFIVIDNRRWLHGRRSFPAGSSRLLIRAWYGEGCEQD